MDNSLPNTQFKLFLRFLKLLVPHKNMWFLIVALSGLGTMLSLVNPYITKLVIDKGIANRDLKKFILLAVIAGVVFILSGLIDGLIQFLENRIQNKMKFNLNKKVFSHLQRLPFSYFTNKSSGEHVYKFHYDIEKTIELITTIPPQAVSLFPRLVLILGIVFYLNWKMAALSLLLAPLLYFSTYFFAKKMRKAWKEYIKSSQSILQVLFEKFSHIKLIKSFGAEVQTSRQYLRMLCGNIRMKIKNVKLEIVSVFSSQTLTKIIVGLIIFYGGYQVIKGESTLGSLVAIMVYLNQLMGLQNKFANFFQTSALGLVSCQRLAEILDERIDVFESKEAKRMIFKNGRIILQDVSFGYKSNQPVLERISFIIEGASNIALVGPSGCGKTTMLNLILRLYDPWSGDIMIDGCNINNLKFSSLREQIGIVLQEPLLWNDTIENNIRYGKPVASEQEILEVAQACGVDEFARFLPEKYMTVIGESACKISEGQKQKIAIARALIKKPKILILDEAMSSMDSASEEKILANIKEIQKELTLIIVSHRLSTIMNTGLVYYLESKDRLVVDTAKNLLEKSRNFANLFVGQSAIYI